ncbi:hypothetical protein BROUX41_001844 [Berkeleyomyces rouxiae]|uniref:uncharacterized protein n=1 Tax=Berkeleyomyces rouxiae TaxID=2035830 RepID=UPI003B78CFB9
MRYTVSCAASSMAPPAVINPSLADLNALILTQCPPIDKSWADHEAAKVAASPPSDRTVVKEKKSHVSSKAKAKQQSYAHECRLLNRRLMAPDGLFPELAHGVQVKQMAARSTLDNAKVPILRYSRRQDAGTRPDAVLIYYHGGGLWIGEADSEELSCRKLLVGNYHVYSVGYRLLPDYAGSVCLSDAVDACQQILRWAVPGPRPRVVIVGSSSGGELAALVSQHVVQHSLETSTAIPFCGTILRCPVTSDVWSGRDYVPEPVRHMHTTAQPAFYTSIAGDMKRLVPRDGLEAMPLEAPPHVLAHMPPTWLQLATNDVLYADGLCYAALLRIHQRALALDVVHNFPHTFWLLAPHLPRAITADAAMVDGLRWILQQAEETETEAEA